MYPVLHDVLVVLYAVLPAVALAWALWKATKRKRPEPIVAFIITCLSGVIIGTAVIVMSAAIFRGRVRLWSVAHAWYYVTALLMLIHGFRWVARRVSWKLLRVPRNEIGQVVDPRGVRASIAFLLQSVLMVGLGLPFVTAAMLVYRVPIYTTETPATVADCLYQAASFKATDGTPLAGWWVPAAAERRGTRLDSSFRARHRTVLMCGALGDTLPRYAGLMRALVADGYNVLAFDLRANGQSGGHWTGFGDVERLDVLAALAWVKREHAEESERVYAVGFGIGGAAVIGAAADPSGEAIDGVAVFGTYARFNTFASGVMDLRLTGPVRWLAQHLTLPIASAHAGVDLARLAPADAVSQLWPRPLLVIHGRGDDMVPFSEGQDLFRAATFPKESLWVPNDHAGVYRNRDAARALLRFFERARPLPAV